MPRARALVKDAVTNELRANVPATKASPAPASSTTSLAAAALEVVPVTDVRHDAPVIVRRSSSSDEELGVGEARPVLLKV
jgi:hypothetical protein